MQLPLLPGSPTSSSTFIVRLFLSSYGLGRLEHFSDTVTSHGHWTGSECVIQNTSHSGISIYFTLARDLLLLILMLVGLLRWKGALQSDGVCRFMYTQVDLLSLPSFPLYFYQLTRNTGFSVGSCRRPRRGASCGAF